MELRHLRYFVAVAEERHFSRAADRLHVAQPPLSQQIKQLEDELDAALLERTTRRVDLTPAGELMLTRAQALLTEVDRMVQDVRLVAEGAAGVVRVGVVGSAAYRLMPEIVQAARTRMPSLHMHVQAEMLTPELTEALETGRIDVAVLRPPVRSEDLEVKLLEQDELMVALPGNHSLADSSSIALSDLADDPFVCYPQGSAVAAATFEATRRTGFRPHIAQEAGETSTLLAFVAAGMGVALVPMTQRGFSVQGVVFRPLDSAPVVDLALAWRRTAETALVRRFISLFDILEPGPSGSLPDVADSGPASAQERS
ncbi:LysR family transcriptional regulator [Brevibacterium daeguense]|uniref:LysR family transcriptional regulator n=1 Tax=Brevibacterium daeguense TaxID=909936 RepID=A0ABP8ELV9_9MICO|nr:LysR substrate-binding domain-containing protein [Brevibacterium daeguense]